MSDPFHEDQRRTVLVNDAFVSMVTKRLFNDAPCDHGIRIGSRPRLDGELVSMEHVGSKGQQGLITAQVLHEVLDPNAEAWRLTRLEEQLYGVILDYQRRVCPTGRPELEEG